MAKIKVMIRTTDREIRSLYPEGSWVICESWHCHLNRLSTGEEK